MQSERSGIQITSALIFMIVALLLLFASVWIGLAFANQLVDADQPADHGRRPGAQRRPPGPGAGGRAGQRRVRACSAAPSTA